MRIYLCFVIFWGSIFHCALCDDCYEPGEVYSKCGPENPQSCDEPSNNSCGKHEEWQDCGTSCPKTCETRFAMIKCIADCAKGCFCKEGFIRSDETNECIPENKCDICNKNEYYQLCGTACPATCKEPNPPICTDNCVEGCFCRDGFVRDCKNRCVRLEQCEFNEDDCTCKENHKIYTTCGSACPPTCENYNETVVCTKQCVMGCFCKSPYILNNQDECVKPEDCLN